MFEAARNSNPVQLLRSKATARSSLQEHTALRLHHSFSSHREGPRHHGIVTQKDTRPYNPCKTKKALVCWSATSQKTALPLPIATMTYQSRNFCLRSYFGLCEIQQLVFLYHNMRVDCQRLNKQDGSLITVQCDMIRTTVLANTKRYYQIF